MLNTGIAKKQCVIKTDARENSLEKKPSEKEESSPKQMSIWNAGKEEITISALLKCNAAAFLLWGFGFVLFSAELDPNLLDSWSSYHPVKRFSPTVQNDEWANFERHFWASYCQMLQPEVTINQLLTSSLIFRDCLFRHNFENKKRRWTLKWNTSEPSGQMIRSGSTWRNTHYHTFVFVFENYETESKLIIYR